MRDFIGPKEIREKYRATQKDFAHIVGVSHIVISRYERKRLKVLPERLDLIIKAYKRFGATPEEIDIVKNYYTN